MTVTAASFKARFPEFDSVADATIEIYIDDAILILNETYWGTKYDLGINYLAAHFLTLANRTAAGNSGSFTMRSGRAVDGSSVSYAVPTINDQGDAYYSSTGYGQRYLALRKTLGIPAYVV